MIERASNRGSGTGSEKRDRKRTPGGKTDGRKRLKMIKRKINGRSWFEHQSDLTLEQMIVEFTVLKK